MVKGGGEDGARRGGSKGGSWKGGHICMCTVMFATGIPTKWIADVSAESSAAKTGLMVCQTTMQLQFYCFMPIL